MKRGVMRNEGAVVKEKTKREEEEGGGLTAPVWIVIAVNDKSSTVVG